MIRERAVELEIERNELDPRLLEERLVDRPHAVGGVDHDLELASAGGLAQEGQHVLAVGLEDAGVPDLAGDERRWQIAGRDLRFHERDAVIAGHGIRLVTRELEAVVLGGVVAGGGLDAAGRLQMADREIVHRRGRETDVDHVEARFDQTLGERRRQAFPRRPHVARDHHGVAEGAVLLVEHELEGEADLLGQRLVELLRHDAADVVCLENAGHGDPFRCDSDAGASAGVRGC